MIWFIIGLVVAIAIIIYICCDDWNDLSEKIGISMVTLLVSFILSSLLWMWSSVIISCCTEAKYNMVSDTKIIALKDNQNISGNLYIMGGRVDEELYYCYATETKFGYKTEKIKAENAYIQYTDGETHIEKYEGEFANNSTYLWGVSYV